MAYTERRIETPIGPMQLVASDEHIVEIRLPNRVEPTAAGEAAPTGSAAKRSAQRLLDRAAQQLLEYFAGRRSEFDLPLSPRGTAFQRAVWRQLQLIPHGTTRSYGALASALGRPRAARAVGAANARNPHAVVVPCHRVVGQDGSLTGFAGGLEVKRWLLEHERSHPRG